MTQTECQHSDPPLEKVDDSIQRVIRQARQSADQENNWINAIRCHRSVDTILAVLLPSLPCLEYLECSLGSLKPYCDRMLRSALGQRGKFYPETAFAQLQEVVVP